MEMIAWIPTTDSPTCGTVFSNVSPGERNKKSVGDRHAVNVVVAGGLTGCLKIATETPAATNSAVAAATPWEMR